MKKYQCLFFVVCILAIYSCQKFDGAKTENGNNTDIANIAMLSFSSEEDFIAALNQQDDDVTTRACFATKAQGGLTANEKYVDLLEPVQNLPIATDPILRVDCRPLKEQALIENNDMSLYIAKGYDSLVPNIKVAKLLNARAEVMVDQTIYKISPRGTYYFPESKQKFFESNYERFETEEGIQMEENTYQLAEDIYRINTFEITEVLDAEAEDLPDDLPGVLDDDDLSTNIVNTLNMTTRTVTTQIPPFERFPRFNADAKTWLGKLWQSIFGRNRGYTYKLSKKHRMKGKFYYYNYKFYTEFGASAEMQKKNWIGWSGKQASELLIGWSNIIFSEGYKRIPDYPKNAEASIVSTEYKTIPGFNHQGMVLTIVGLDITSLQQQQLSLMNPIQIRNWFKLRVENSNVDITQLDAIQCFSADKVITILPGGQKRKGDVKKVREIFLSEVSFTINLDLNHMPQSFKEWAKIINQGKFKIKPKNLKFGTVYVAGRLGNSWGGMTIVKKS